jgi:methionine sulfoxide reductase heme-binding subunit
MKSKYLFILLFILILLPLRTIFAEDKEEIRINYRNQPVVDSDLDGVTDEGEKQISNTDSQNSDTDKDGFGDGIERISGTDPLNSNSYPGVPIQQIKKEMPWAWYVARTGGLVGFLLLYFSMLLGLAIRTPILNKIIKPKYSCRPHCWISLQALIFAFLHGFSLLFDKYLSFGFKDILVPFSSKFSPLFLSLGIISFYLIIILVVSSYLRRFIPDKLWRFLHSLNVALYIFTLIHALFLGTDLKVPLIRNVFLAMNGFLILLLVINLFFRIFRDMKQQETPGDSCPN